MKPSVPELLAPAGTPGALEAACAAGADAVYLGAARFGARAGAGFDPSGLEDAIAFAHARDVRVYVTVNTLVAEAELGAVAGTLLRCYEVGADAVLVQDAGVAAIAREVVPALPLHASTQMAVHSADGVRAAAGLGCTRVVLARELPLAAIEAIASAVPGVELEVFAHGALCYAWSGQCLMSSAIGGRSGNRGLCAQPCRKPYRLLRGVSDEWGRLEGAKPVPLDDRYLLSPRDLWTYPEVGRLVRAPIAALKIEGRLRSPAYVGTVVGCYRAALDRAAAGVPAPAPDEVEALGLAFNRGLTRGRLFGDPVMGRDRPGPRGVRIGTVVGTETDASARVELEDGVRLERGDGVVAAPRGHPDLDCGAVLRHTPSGGRITIAFGRPVDIGTPVYLTGRRTPWTPPSVTVELEVEVAVDGERRLVAEGRARRRRGSPVPFRAAGGDALPPSRSRPLSADVVAGHLARTGGTAYSFSRIDVDLPDGLFAPPSVLNAFRRAVLASAAEALAASARPSAADRIAARERLAVLCAPLRLASAPSSPAVPRVRCLVDSSGAAGAAAAAGADEVGIEPEVGLGTRCACLLSGPDALLAVLGEASRACGEVPVLWAWPRITPDSFLSAAVPLIARAPVDGIVVEGCGAAVAIAGAGLDVPVHGGQGLNLWNSRAVCRLAPRFASLTLSPELSGAEIADVVAAARAAGCDLPLAVHVQGNLEVMVTEDCLPLLDACPTAPGDRFALEDERRRRFVVRKDAGCRSRVLNSVETCLIDYLPALASAGIECVVVDARGRTGRWATAAVRSYRTAIDALALDHGERDARLARERERLRRISAGGITSGPFVRGRKEKQSEPDTR